MARVTDSNEWFEIWFADKNAMIDTMYRNMAADIAAGYQPQGACIQKQLADIAAYKAEFDAQMSEFWKMDDKQVNRWCFYDMKKRGVIE